jgi:hypothetical protein
MKWIRSFLLGIALLVCPAAHATAPPPDPSPTEGYAYLGQIDASGAWVEQHFVGVPDIAPRASETALRVPADVQVRTGVKLMSHRHGEPIGRLRRGAHVQLFSIRVSGSGDAWYAWGRVSAQPAALALSPYADRSHAPTMRAPALAVRSHTRDGFTGRSGSGPTRAAPQLHGGGITRSTC